MQKEADKKDDVRPREWESKVKLPVFHEILPCPSNNFLF